MKILVINGSPKGKRSNTYRLTQTFLEGIKLAEEKSSQPNPEIFEIDLTQADIKPCLGCFSCWNKTPGKCCINDYMQTVLQKMLWADITIWSFPLYYYNVPGKLKTLIDRQLPLVLPFMTERTDQVGNGSHASRYDMSKKRTVLISTCGFYTTKGNYDSVLSMFDHICGKNNYTTLFCGQGELFRVPEVLQRTNEYLGFVRKAGQEYASGKISENTQTKLNQLLYPKEVFERMADASWGIEKENEEKEDESLIFTKQMAALYRKESYSGTDIVLEMAYTDIDKQYQIILSKEGSQVFTESSAVYTTRIETPLGVWRSIASGEINGGEALMKGMYSIKGDFSILMNWGNYFGAP